MYSVQTYLLLFDKIFRFQIIQLIKYIFYIPQQLRIHTFMYIYMHTTHNISILSLLRKKTK